MYNAWNDHQHQVGKRCTVHARHSDYALLSIMPYVAYYSYMSWAAYFHPKFKAEFDELSVVVQDELLASLVPLREYGPSLGRPEVDTLNNSKYAKWSDYDAWNDCSG